MINGQYQIDGFQFGARTQYEVRRTPYLVNAFGMEPGELDTNETLNVLEDGTTFDEEYQGGMTLNFEMTIRRRDNLPATDDLGRFMRSWRPRSVVESAEAVSTLKMCKNDRVRIVYGRGRPVLPQFGSIEQGYAPITTQFKAVDNCFYDEVQEVERVGLSVPPTAGFTSDFREPLIVSQYAEAQGVIEVIGDRPTWMTFIIKGPCINPIIKIEGEWEVALNLTLDHTQFVTIDPRPWNRGTYRSDGVSMAGRYTSGSVIPRRMKLDPGRYFCTYQAYDTTLKSNVEVGWRPAWETP